RSVEEVEVEASQLMPARPAVQATLDLPEEGWGYCTEFLVHGDDLDVEVIRDEIEALGNSVLVVGDPELVKVHVHTDDPSRVITLVARHGRVDRLSVGDMSSQHKRIREQAGEAAPEVPAPAAPAEVRPNGVGLGAVVSGPGLVEVVRS